MSAYSVSHLPGRGGRDLELIPERPDWWTLAGCRGDGPGEWVGDRGESAKMGQRRAACRSCPVSGDCLADAMTMAPRLREFGPMRCGTVGARPWRRVGALVDEFGPVTPDDWSVLSAWILDGDASAVA